MRIRQISDSKIKLYHTSNIRLYDKDGEAGRIVDKIKYSLKIYKTSLGNDRYDLYDRIDYLNILNQISEKYQLSNIDIREDNCYKEVKLSENQIASVLIIDEIFIHTTLSHIRKIKISNLKK